MGVRLLGFSGRSSGLVSVVGLDDWLACFVQGGYSDRIWVVGNLSFSLLDHFFFACDLFGRRLPYH